MYKIIVKGDADQEIYGEDSCECDCPNCDSADLLDVGEFDGLDCDADFVDYIHDEKLKEKLIEGFCEFKLENNILMTITTYKTKKKLTKKDLEDLKKYTQGQWSDGIGEGFEQQLHNDGYVSMWHVDQQITVEQIKEEKKNA